MGQNMTKSIMCPSTDIHESTHLLGTVNIEGMIDFRDHLLPVPNAVLSVLTKDDLTNRVRLTGPCIKQNCQWWLNNECSLAKEFAKIAVSSGSPKCAISDRCRWRIENGDDCCEICSFVTIGRSTSDVGRRQK